MAIVATTGTTNAPNSAKLALTGYIAGSLLDSGKPAPIYPALLRLSSATAQPLVAGMPLCVFPAPITGGAVGMPLAVISTSLSGYSNQVTLQGTYITGILVNPSLRAPVTSASPVPQYGDNSVVYWTPVGTNSGAFIALPINAVNNNAGLTALQSITNANNAATVQANFYAAAGSSGFNNIAVQRHYLVQGFFAGTTVRPGALDNYSAGSTSAPSYVIRSIVGYHPGGAGSNGTNQTDKGNINLIPYWNSTIGDYQWADGPIVICKL